MKRVNTDMLSANMHQGDEHDQNSRVGMELENIRKEITEKQELLDKIIDGLWDDERKKEVISLSKDLDELINGYLKLKGKI